MPYFPPAASSSGSRGYGGNSPVLDLPLTSSGADRVMSQAFTHQNASPAYLANGIDFGSQVVYDRLTDPLAASYPAGTALKVIRNLAVAVTYQLAIGGTAKGHIVSFGNRNQGISIHIGGSAALNTAGRRLWTSQDGQQDNNTAIDLPNDGLPHRLVFMATTTGVAAATLYLWMDGALVWTLAATTVVAPSGTYFFSIGTLQAGSDTPTTGDSNYQLNAGFVSHVRLYQDATLTVGRDYHASLLT